jgi:hypothetical protein
MLITLNYWAGLYAAAACIAFALIYSTITPWWKSVTGRLIMMLMGGLAGLAILSVIFGAYRDVDLARSIKAVLVIVIGTAIWGHVATLLIVQLRGRKSRKSKHRA